MAIVKDKYYDFGPTLAAEKLAEIEGIVLHDRLQRIDHGEIVENKRLSNVLAFIQEKQAELNCERSKSVPRRLRYMISAPSW